MSRMVSRRRMARAAAGLLGLLVLGMLVLTVVLLGAGSDRHAGPES